MRLLVLYGVFILSGCAAVGAGDAVVNTAIGVGASAVRRAQGDCYTPCTPGTTCNRENGLCEPLPCRGACAFDEKCESTYKGDTCVPAKAGPLPSTP